MRTVHLAHCYYDLLNLYGEKGNLWALKKELEHQGAEVVIHQISFEDELDFSNMDLVYLGAGTEENQKEALRRLCPYRSMIQEYIEQGKCFLVTGNACDYFGQRMIEENGESQETLKMFSYTTQRGSKRIIGEALFQSEDVSSVLIGFQNQCSMMSDHDQTWFSVIKGVGCTPDNQKEGIRYKHFYGTSMLGPLLVRNPALLKFMVQQLWDDCGFTEPLQEFDLGLNEQAYENFMKKFYPDYLK